jgi:hypothetical protein
MRVVVIIDGKGNVMREMFGPAIHLECMVSLQL